MLIQRLVNDGAVITLGNESYQFSQDDQGRYVCEVQVPAHIKRLLSIDVYRSLSGEDHSDPEPEGDKVLTATDDGQNDNEQEADQEEPATEPESAEQATEGAKDGDGETQPDAMGRKELEEAYKKLTGKKPHHRLSDERIRQLIEEAKED